MALVGFSQGAGLAYEVGPRRPDQMAGVVAIAGRMKRKHALATEVRSKPPFLILTGAEDNLMPTDEIAQTAATLSQVGIPAMKITMAGVGHRISDVGIAAASDFVKTALQAAN